MARRRIGGYPEFAGAEDRVIPYNGEPRVSRRRRSGQARIGKAGRRSGGRRSGQARIKEIRDQGDQEIRPSKEITSCASVRHTDACHSQGAQGTDREPPKLAHVRQPMTEVINPAWGFLARSKRGTRPMPAWLFGGTRQRRIQFCASGWEETKEGAAVWWRSPDDRTWL